MAICDDSQLPASEFYTGLHALYQYSSSLASIATILSNTNNLKTTYYNSSGHNSIFCQYLVQAYRTIFTPIMLTFVHSLGILLNFIYKHLYFGSVCLNDCTKNTGKSYSLSIENWQGMGFSTSNCHFVSDFSVTDLTEKPVDLYSITSYDNSGDPAGIDSQTKLVTTTLKFICVFNLMDVDLKKLFDFTEGENTYNLIDALISVLRVSDNAS